MAIRKHVCGGHMENEDKRCTVCVFHCFFSSDDEGREKNYVEIIITQILCEFLYKEKLNENSIYREKTVAFFTF